ncbi:MAG: energy-coupling factor transporter transmembrane protein EcfT [Treponema sp.]|nr:energy-coupling factor transporter transmembrane protein EcfT [Treponema sp.]
MAQVTFFHYIHKDTVLHRMDGRLKLLCMILLSLSASLASEGRHYLVLLCIIAAALSLARLPIPALLKDMKFFGLIIIIVLLSNAFNVSGDPIPGFPIQRVSQQGLILGLRFGGRLILIIMVCAVMTGTTSLLTFKNVIEWYLRPLPFINEARIAMTINLTFVLLPVIFDCYTEMTDAQRSRCVGLRKNPVKRIGFIAFPLLGQTLRRADEIVFAMESRCYSEPRTGALFKVNKIDWLILTLCLGILTFIVLL